MEAWRRRAEGGVGREAARGREKSWSAAKEQADEKPVASPRQLEKRASDFGEPTSRGPPVCVVERRLARGI